MYILEKDLPFFEKLCAKMHVSRKERFLNILLECRTGGHRNRSGRIAIADNYVLDQGGIEPEEFLTRKIIKRAFTEAKEDR